MFPFCRSVPSKTLQGARPKPLGAGLPAWCAKGRMCGECVRRKVGGFYRVYTGFTGWMFVKLLVWF